MRDVRVGSVRSHGFVGSQLKPEKRVLSLPLAVDNNFYDLVIMSDFNWKLFSFEDKRKFRVFYYEWNTWNVRFLRYSCSCDYFRFNYFQKELPNNHACSVAKPVDEVDVPGSTSPPSCPCDVASSLLMYLVVRPLRELNLRHARLDRDDECYLILRCPNLEVLYTDNSGYGDEKLQVIGQFCKKMCKLKITGSEYMSSDGIIAIAQGCLNLEYLHIRLRVISNEAMECIGFHLKNLRIFRMTFGYADRKTALPQDDGIRAMLVGCSKLEWLGIYNRGLTDVGLDYIGKYGRNLIYLSLG
nr:hypothetical protein [Tanacetum cinerariifolium]